MMKSIQRLAMFLAVLMTSVGTGGVLAQDVQLEFGDFAPGDTVVVCFEVVVDDPFPAGVDSVANQGVVSGDNTAAVWTDDPDTPEPDDPTVTPVVSEPPLCLPFFEQQEFEDFMLETGKFLKGVETFEESNMPPGEVTSIPAPLDQFPNVDPAGFGFPDGLEQTNIVIWDNISPEPNPPELNPSGDPQAIAVFGENFLGANTEKIAINFFATPSMDLVFTEPNHTGIGFTLSYLQGFVGDGWHISVFNKIGDEIGKFQVPSPGSMEPSKSFFGIWCDETIGRINIFDKSLTGDAIDNIQMWREIPDAVEDGSGIVHEFALYPSTPNPFNPRTILRFSVPVRSRVDLSIFDIAGRRVKTLVSEELGAGMHSAVWDGRDEEGRPMSSGVFFGRLTTREDTKTRKLMLLK
jgi:hypothetical protein